MCIAEYRKWPVDSKNKRESVIPVRNAGQEDCKMCKVLLKFALTAMTFDMIIYEMKESKLMVLSASI